MPRRYDNMHLDRVVAEHPVRYRRMEVIHQNCDAHKWGSKIVYSKVTIMIKDFNAQGEDDGEDDMES
jgi:hypothetical protein